MYSSTLIKPEFADYMFSFWLAFSIACAYLLWIQAKSAAEWFADQRYHEEHTRRAVRMNPLELFGHWGIATMAMWWMVGIPMLENLIPSMVSKTPSGHWQDSEMLLLLIITGLVSLILSAFALWIGVRKIIPREYPNSRFRNRWLPTLKMLGPRRWQLEAN